MGFAIIHHIKTEEDFKVLCTCPICLKDMCKTNLIEHKQKLLPTKELIIYEFKEKESKDSITITCPHCEQFRMTYVNCLEKKQIDARERINGILESNSGECKSLKSN